MKHPPKITPKTAKRAAIGAAVMLCGASYFLSTRKGAEEPSPQARIEKEHRTFRDYSKDNGITQIRREFAYLHSHLSMFGGQTGRFPGGRLEDPGSEVRQELQLMPEDVRLPSDLLLRRPGESSKAAQPSERFYIPYYDVPGFGGRIQQPRGRGARERKRDVWMVAHLLGARSMPDGFFVLWSTGEIQFIEDRDMLVYLGPSATGSTVQGLPPTGWALPELHFAGESGTPMILPTLGSVRTDYNRPPLLPDAVSR